jgi:hypothetical protein
LSNQSYLLLWTANQSSLFLLLISQSYLLLSLGSQSSWGSQSPRLLWLSCHLYLLLWLWQDCLFSWGSQSSQIIWLSSQS